LELVVSILGGSKRVVQDDDDECSEWKEMLGTKEGKE
jgi:hypothetical protein